MTALTGSYPSGRGTDIPRESRCFHLRTGSRGRNFMEDSHASYPNARRRVLPSASTSLCLPTAQEYFRALQLVLWLGYGGVECAAVFHGSLPRSLLESRRIGTVSLLSCLPTSTMTHVRTVTRGRRTNMTGPAEGLVATNRRIRLTSACCACRFRPYTGSGNRVWSPSVRRVPICPAGRCASFPRHGQGKSGSAKVWSSFRKESLHTLCVVTCVER